MMATRPPPTQATPFRPTEMIPAVADPLARFWPE